MADNGPMDSTSNPTVLAAVEVGDDGEAWASAGFTVEAGRVHLDNLEIVLSGSGGRRGLTGLALDPSPGAPVDGLPVADPGADRVLDGEPLHVNGAVTVDHIVVRTPDLDRTSAALADLGWSPRRTADIEGRNGRFSFYVVPTRSGKVVVEVIQHAGTDDPAGPARFWGLAITVDDLDAAAARIGPSGIGRPKAAVQPGRRIATVRGDALGITVPLALMSSRLSGR